MIYMFLAPGFEEVEALFPLDLLRRAGLEIRTVGLGGRLVRGAHGIAVEADMAEADYAPASPAEAIILPGGMPGTTNLDASHTVDEALRQAAARGAWLCAICAAPMVLGKRGYLRGLRATCYPGCEDALLGALEIGGRVIRDGHVITAAGAGVAMEFGLEIISALKSPDEAGRIRASIRAI